MSKNKLYPLSYKKNIQVEGRGKTERMGAGKRRRGSKQLDQPLPKATLQPGRI
jgi:hypothetical protein